MTPPFASDAVAAAFDAFPALHRAGLLHLRALIFQTAAAQGVGPLTETLKWGQPSYVPQARGVGTPLRLAVTKTGDLALLVHCQTRVIPDFVDAFPGMDRIDGTRAVLFRDATEIDPARHGLLIAAALTYHR